MSNTYYFPKAFAALTEELSKAASLVERINQLSTEINRLYEDVHQTTENIIPDYSEF